MLTPTAPDRDLVRRRVLVVGVGGLGSPAASALAAAGVGMLGLVDPDVVEVSNLHRQPLFERADIGRAKVEIAAARLRASRPDLDTQTWRLWFDATHADLVRQFDAVVDGTDTIAAKFAVNDAAVVAGVPLVHAGVLGFRVQLLTVLPGSTCYRCVFEAAPPPSDIPSCEEAGVLGPLPALAGALQAGEVIRLLTGRRVAFADRLLAIDARLGTWRTVPVAPSPRCPACAAWRATSTAARSASP